MNTGITIQQASLSDAHDIAVMVGELLNEIMSNMNISFFNFNLQETTDRLADFIAQGKYCVFIANNTKSEPIGFIALFEGYALYAEGAFGTIPELFVRPDFRSQGIGKRLLERAKKFGIERGWKRLEVTTPPLPQFDKTISFYEREKFEITGGRKLKVLL